MNVQLFPGKVDDLSFDVDGPRSSEGRSTMKVRSWQAIIENEEVKFKDENLKFNN